MSASTAMGVFLAEKDRAYKDGFEARRRGEPITAYGSRESYAGPLAREGWESGWKDADGGKPNKMASGGPGATKLQFWKYVALAIAFLALMSWLFSLK